MRSNTLGKLLTPDEAAVAIRTTPEHVRHLLRAGKLVGFRLNDGPRARYRVPETELERFIAERQTAKETS